MNEPDGCATAPSAAPPQLSRHSYRSLMLDGLRRTVPTVLAWATLSFSLTYYNSWILSSDNNRFPFPMFYTMWHMIVQVIGTSVIFVVRPTWQRPSLDQFQQQWRLVVALTLVAFISIGGENQALTVVSLTVHESIKSATPLLTMIFAFFLESRHYTFSLMCSVIGLTVRISQGLMNPQNSPHTVPLRATALATRSHTHTP